MNARPTSNIIRITCILICLMCVGGGIFVLYSVFYTEDKFLSPLWVRASMFVIGIVIFLPPIFYWLSVKSEKLLHVTLCFRLLRGMPPKSFEYLFRKRDKSFFLQMINLYAGQSPTTNESGQTIALIHFDKKNIPSFLVLPKTLSKNISNSELNPYSWDTKTLFFEKYAMECSNERGIKDIFTETLQQFLQENNLLCIEGVGNKILISQNLELIPENQLTSFFETCQKIGKIITCPVQKSI